MASCGFSFWAPLRYGVVLPSVTDNNRGAGSRCLRETETCFLERIGKGAFSQGRIEIEERLAVTLFLWQCEPIAVGQVSDHMRQLDHPLGHSAHSSVLAHGGELNEVSAEYEGDVRHCELAHICPELQFHLRNFFTNESITLHHLSRSGPSAHEVISGPSTITKVLRN